MQDQIIQALRRNAAAEAVALGRDWVATDAGSAQAHRWLGVALQQQGDIDEAMASLRQAIALAPEDADLHLLQAGLLLAARDLVGAGAVLARTTALDPNQLAAYLMQAHLAIARGDLDEAERLGRLASRVSPEHPQLGIIDGVVALRRGDADRALALLSTAAQQLPDDPRLLFALGFAYMQKEHFAFAERAFERVAVLNPPGTTVRALIAQLKQRQGRVEEAAEALRAVIAEPEGDTPAIRRLAGEFELQAGRPAEAIEHLTAALAAWPGNRRVLQGLLMGWRQLGADELARTTLDAALERDPRLGDLWAARLALSAVGSEEAVDVTERWLLAMPEHLPALETLMRLHDLRGEGDEAEMVARQIVAIEPGRFSGEERIVEALLQRDPPAAIACVQSLMEGMAPQDRTTMRPWLGSVQDRAGQPAAALATWLEFHREQAQHRLPLPPHGKPQPEQWPPLAPVAADNGARPLLLWGAPGSCVELLAPLLQSVSPVLRADRYGIRPPADALQNYRTVKSLAEGRFDATQLVAGWRAALPQRGIADGNVIDWLLWWDNSVLLALRPHLPEGRLAIALRDPRDMLLDWIAHGAPLPLALDSPLAGAQWLAESLSQIATLHEQDLYPHKLLRLDGRESDPRALSEVLTEAFGVPFATLPATAPARLPGGRWRAYRDELGQEFDLLSAVAVRLGYSAE
ncbi:MAG TPA: tetratricopeptide repeat protein [Stenotrophomonas sp.]|jgi:tetratricopeptide (TPR) repeat protein